MRHAVHLAILATVLALAVGRPAMAESAPEGPWIAAAGTLNNFLVVTSAPSVGEVDFQYWQRDAAGLWHFGGFGQGEPTAVAAWREDLLVFFPSGRYGLFGLDSKTVNPSPVPSWTAVAACEDGLAVDVFGWNASDEPIYARYKNDKWSWYRVPVALERGKVLDPCAVCYGDRFYVIWREESPGLIQAKNDYRVRFMYLDKAGKWQLEPSRLHVVSRPLVASDESTMVFLFQKPDDEADRWTLATYSTGDDDWHEIGPLVGTIPAGPAAMGRQGSKFYMAVLADGGPRVAALDVPSARAGEFTPLPVVESQAKKPSDQNLMLIWGLAILTFLMLMLSWRRWKTAAGNTQGAASRPAPAAAPSPARAMTLAPAPLLRRAAAGAIDHFLMFVLVAPVTPTLPPDAAERVVAGDPALAPKVLTIALIFTVAIIAYSILAEGAFGRTLGKVLLGIEVRRARDGGPITWGQAVVRNLMRAIDMYPFPYLIGLVSIFIGPRSQRLGDRAARTMVVLRPSSQETASKP